MADTHIEVDEAKARARTLMGNVRELTTRLASLDDLLAAMGRMKDGDGSQASHFTKVVDLFGVEGADADAKLTKAKTLHDELASTRANSAALRQFLAITG